MLGAVVSPTDPLAATSIAQRFGIPRRIVAIVEGEGLVNDGSALVLYKFAVLAVVSGSISMTGATLSFIWTVVGGVGIGLALGWVIRQVRLRLHNPPLEITIALLTGYFTFIPAYLLGASGVLAVVTAGVYVGWYTPQLTTVETRLQGDAVWEILTFLLNGLLFVTVGLSLPAVLDGLGGHITTTLVWQALAVVAAVIVIRFLWVFPATYVPRALSTRIRAADPYPPWQYPALISWTGMRGAVSLAAALAIPLHTDAGVDFPGRDLIIYLTFAVILATLVGQGLTMPMVIRALGLEDDGVAEREAVKARIHAADAALNRIDRAERRGVGARGYGRSAAQVVPVPAQPVRGALHGRRRRRDRGAVGRLPAAATGADRGGATGRRRAARCRGDRRRRDAGGAPRAGSGGGPARSVTDWWRRPPRGRIRPGRG